MQGLAVGAEGMAEKICAEAFERGLILETSGPKGEVMKVMPPLTITEEALLAGLEKERKPIFGTKTIWRLSIASKGKEK